MQKYGIILVDEISVREALTVCSKSLTYKNLVDFGDDYKASDTNEKATSCLVFMFQPLAATYSQPVAVFASREPVVGTELAKLMLKCIILLEQAGAIIHGFVSDGAQTNRKMWSELGISGQVAKLIPLKVGFNTLFMKIGKYMHFLIHLIFLRTSEINYTMIKY